MSIRMSAKPWEPTKTAKHDLMVVDYRVPATLGNGLHAKLAIPTGIDRINPALMIVSSVVIASAVNSGMSEVLQKGFFSITSENKTAFRDTAGTVDNYIQLVEPQNALAFAEWRAEKADQPIIPWVNQSKRVFEEEIFLNVAFGLDHEPASAVTSSAELDVFVRVEFKKYKVTEKVWREEALNGTLQDRFL